MRAYSYILARLVSCWGTVPSEVVAAGLFAVPGIYGLLAGLPYGLGLLADAFVFWWCKGMLEAHVWPDIPPEHREILLELRDRIRLLPHDRGRPAIEAESTKLAVEDSGEASARSRTPVRLPSMPTVHREGGYRFFFFSNENDEPPHVHVQHGEFAAKFWLEDVKLAENCGFASHRLTRIQSMIEQHQEAMLRKWHEHFGT